MAAAAAAGAGVGAGPAGAAASAVAAPSNKEDDDAGALFGNPYHPAFVPASGVLYKLGFPDIVEGTDACTRIIVAIRSAQAETDPVKIKAYFDQVQALVDDKWNKIDPLLYARLAFANVQLCDPWKDTDACLWVCSVFSPLGALIGNRLDPPEEHSVTLAAACALVLAYGTDCPKRTVEWARVVSRTMAASVIPPADYTPVHHAAYNAHAWVVLNISPRFFVETKQQMSGDAALEIALSDKAEEQHRLWTECDFKCVELPRSGLFDTWRPSARNPVDYSPQDLAVLDLFERGVLARAGPNQEAPFPYKPVELAYNAWLFRKGYLIVRAMYGFEDIPSSACAKVIDLVVGFCHYTIPR